MGGEANGVARTRRGPRRPSGAPSGRDEVTRAVLDAAARLFAARGVGAVSLRDVAAEADVKVALIGRYIGRRDDLIDAVMADLSEQVAASVLERPLSQQSFEKDSALGQWATLLVYFSITGRDLAPASDANPVRAVAKVARDAYGIDERSALLRGAQVVGSAVGWRLIEPYLIQAGELDDVPLEWLHESLTEVHRRIGAMPWDPIPPG